MSDLYEMALRFDELNREMNEMSREIDEEIVKAQVFIKKQEEGKKNLCAPLIADIESLEVKIRLAVMNQSEGVEAGGWAFGFSERTSANVKAMQLDIERVPILAGYLKTTPIVTKRRKG